MNVQKYMGQIYGYMSYNLMTTKCYQNPDETRNQGENIADNGGLKVIWIKRYTANTFNYFQAAYHTYKNLTASEKMRLPRSNFTSDQLFWVNS